jgi:hypothetical protein
MSNGKGDFFIMINKQVKKKLDLTRGQIVHLLIEKDNSKYGMEMPEEFKLVLIKL